MRRNNFIMARLKPKFPASVACAPVAPAVEPLPFSFDLRGAAKYTSLSESVIRGATRSGELLVVNNKPITVLRGDLEAWVESRRHRYQVPVLRSGLSKP